MAAVTLLGTVTFNTTAGSKSVTATPAVGDLIVLFCAHTGTAGSTAPTDNQGGTYSLVKTSTKAAGVDIIEVWIRNSLVSSAVSHVITHNPNAGTTSGGGIVACKVTGMSRSGSSAVRQAGARAQAAAGLTPSVTMDTGAILTGNAVLEAIFNTTNPAGLTPPASHTELTDTGYATPATGIEVASRDSGETGSVLTWGSTSATAFCGVAVELDTSAVAGGADPGDFFAMFD